MLVAGEMSGDRHGANLFKALQKRCPQIIGMGMGGKHMAQAGIDIRYDSSNIGVIGVVEVLKHYAEIKRALRKMHNIACQEKPDLLICIDYKEFNFKLARAAKRCGVKVLFYVSPQVWAWRPGRVKKYGQVIDAMAVIFPFETKYYEKENIPVRYVGHPSVDKVKPTHQKSKAFELFSLDPDRPVIGLLPGSRQNEIKRLLPIMLSAAEKVVSQDLKIQFILPQADSISDELLARYLSQSSVKVTVIKQQPYDVIQCCEAILTCSGTATLEIALMGIPMVICYRLSVLTYWLGRLLVKIPFIGLPNIIAGEKIVQEYVQQDATSENLAQECLRLLEDKKYYQRVKKSLLDVKKRVGNGGGSANLAAWVEDILSEPN